MNFAEQNCGNLQKDEKNLQKGEKSMADSYCLSESLSLHFQLDLTYLQMCLRCNQGFLFLRWMKT